MQVILFEEPQAFSSIPDELRKLEFRINSTSQKSD
jgi:hypothetical protein